VTEPILKQFLQLQIFGNIFNVLQEKRISIYNEFKCLLFYTFNLGKLNILPNYNILFAFKTFNNLCVTYNHKQ